MNNSRIIVSTGTGGSSLVFVEFCSKVEFCDKVVFSILTVFLKKISFQDKILNFLCGLALKFIDLGFFMHI